MYTLCHSLSREVEGITAISANFCGDKDLLSWKILQSSSQHLQMDTSTGLHCILACCTPCKMLAPYCPQHMHRAT